MTAGYYNQSNTFVGLLNYIEKGRDKISRKVAHNTVSRLEGEDTIIISYHDSDIVTMQYNKIILDSCGYKTLTTKERLNWYIPSPFSLYQQNHVWYVLNYKNGETHIFKDGLTFQLSNDDWRVDLSTCGKVNDVKKINALKDKIKTYVNNYIDKLMTGEIGAPDGGDCWLCYFQVEGENISWGEKSKDVSHLEEHFKERYYVPSLLMNAIRAFPISQFAQGVLYELWYENETKHDVSWGLGIVQSQVKSSLTKFLYRQFNIA